MGQDSPTKTNCSSPMRERTNIMNQNFRKWTVNAFFIIVLIAAAIHMKDRILSLFLIPAILHFVMIPITRRLDEDFKRCETQVRSKAPFLSTAVRPLAVIQALALLFIIGQIYMIGHFAHLGWNSGRLCMAVLSIAMIGSALYALFYRPWRQQQELRRNSPACAESAMMQ